MKWRFFRKDMLEEPVKTGNISKMNAQVSNIYIFKV